VHYSPQYERRTKLSNHNDDLAKDMARFGTSFDSHSMTAQFLFKPSVVARMVEEVKDTSIASRKKEVHKELQKFRDSIPKKVKDSRNLLGAFISIITIILVISIIGMDETEEWYKIITGLGIVAASFSPSVQTIWPTLQTFFAGSPVESRLNWFVRRVDECIDQLESDEHKADPDNWSKLALTVKGMNRSYNTIDEHLEDVDKLLDAVELAIFDIPSEE
jgi:hypothetical protein